MSWFPVVKLENAARTQASASDITSCFHNAGRERLEELLRLAGWYRWSWPPGGRRRSTNRVVGWPWCYREGAGSRYILILT